MASASAGAPAEHHERNCQAAELLVRVRGTFNPLRVLRPGRTATHLAGVAELVDALVSGTRGGNPVEVQVLSSAPCKQPPRAGGGRGRAGGGAGGGPGPGGPGRPRQG